MLGTTEIVLIVLVILLLFGAKNSKKIIKEISKIIMEIRSLKI